MISIDRLLEDILLHLAVHLLLRQLGVRAHLRLAPTQLSATANLCTKILDVRGLDSNIILIVRGGILMSIGNSPECLSQRILVSRDHTSREIGRTAAILITIVQVRLWRGTSHVYRGRG